MKILQSFTFAYLCGYATAAAIITARTTTGAPDLDKVCDECTVCLNNAAASVDIGAVTTCWDQLCEACAEGPEQGPEQDGQGIDSQSWSSTEDDDDKVCDDCFACLYDADDNEDAEGVCFEKYCNTCKEKHKDDDDYRDED
ncbi:hypothetical protein PG997_013199 [Apiospora hydei]|uniref:Uncharacterized protein n=1 Tax=Apiospora hydei TaxID=1337664 RepID=A0ABR1V5H1_9PEZI